MRFTLIFIGIFLLTTSCMKKEADLLILNARIYTLDSSFSTAEAMAVRDGIILETGTNQEIRDQYTAGQVLDLTGKVVFPGLIDGHCHFYGYGLSLQKIDLRGTQSFEDVLERTLAFHREHPEHTCLEGRGWDQNDWLEAKFPDNTELNKLLPDIPVVLRRIDGHAAVANQAALDVAGFNEMTNIAGGAIEKQNGKLTGILLDNAVDSLLARLPKPSPEEKAQAFPEAQEKCFAKGLTMVCDAGLDGSEIAIIERLQQEGKLKMRIYAMLSNTAENRDRMTKGIQSCDRLVIRSVKLYADGALGSRGAWLKEDYTDMPGHKGLKVTSEEQAREVCQLALNHGFQVNTHAIGDAAVEMMLKIYRSFLNVKNDARWRIEHAQVVDPKDINLFGDYQIIPSIQATHATSDMYWAGKRLGPERVKQAYAYQKLLRQNGWIINGTDFPIEEIDPLLTFYAATTRKDAKGFPEGGFQSENALSREEAIRSMTIWAAQGAFWEDQIGSLEKGKKADFVVLNQDLLQVPDKEILSTQVEAVYLNGEKVF